MSADDIEIIDLFCLVLLLWNFFSLLFVVRIYLNVSNDWHTAVAYQGRFHSADFELLNLPKCFIPSLDFIDGYGPSYSIVSLEMNYVLLLFWTMACTLILCRHVKPVVGRKINRMKAGITECDLVLAVSPRYVKELTSAQQKVSNWIASFVQSPSRLEL